MPRIARIVVPGVPHHITQRGNNRQDIFFVDEDHLIYLDILRKQSQRFGLSIDGYCLMTNHVHIVGRPESEKSLAKAVGRTHFIYTQYVNRLHGRSGHLWQNRFFSCALDERHTLAALRYLERNPVRAGLVQRAWDYPWSSARAHCGEPDQTGLLDLGEWRQRIPPDDWRSTLSSAAPDQELKLLRRCINTGRPLGSDSFLSKVEVLIGRRVRPLPVGRPHKNTDKKPAKSKQ
jgi:putative transposase